MAEASPELLTAMQQALIKAVIRPIQQDDQVALTHAVIPARPTTRKQRRMGNTVGGDSLYPSDAADVKRGDSRKSGVSLKMTHAGSSLEVPYVEGSEQDRKKFMQFYEKQQTLVAATSWANIVGQVAGATLAIVGSVAMTWALVQGVKSNTREN